MRLKSEIWAKAYVRLCYVKGASALVVRRGQSDGGAIYIKVSTLDGRATVYGPAPAGLEPSRQERLLVRCMGDEAASEEDANRYLERQAKFDSDIWVIEVEDRDGRHFLGDSLTDA